MLRSMCRLGVWGAAVPLALSLAVLPGLLFAQGPGGPTLVVLAPVEERVVQVEPTFVGEVGPARRSVIGAAVDGRVLIMHVREGDWVEADQPLVQLKVDTIGIELAGAQEELKLRQEELRELQNGSRPEERDRAEAELLTARAILKYAEAKRERTERLFRGSGNTVTQEELDDAVSAADAARQRTLAVEAAWRLVEAGPREEVIAQAQARVRIQEETIKHIESRIAKHTLRAPFAGYISAEHTQEGEWLTQAGPAVEIVEIDPVEVKIDVPERYISQLAVGLPAEVLIPALPGQAFTGVVKRINPQADPRSRTFRVKIEVANPGEPGRHVLRAGMLAHVRAQLQERALLVPKDALVLSGPSQAVYVAQADPATGTLTAVRRAVEVVNLGVGEGQLIQVRGELRGGERVVVEGNERLRPGQALREVGK